MQTIEKTQIPTKEMIEGLRVGDILPNCFGELKKVTSIHYKGCDINGKFYACFYQEFSETSTMSNSIKEDRPLLVI